MKWAEPTPARVQRIARLLRYQDRLEVLYSDRQSGEQAVFESWKNSSICRCIDGDDGKAVGICGLNGTRIWLLATDELVATESHRRQLIRHGKVWVEALLDSGHYYLENWALASNTTTLRWLKHLGFRIDTPAPLGHSGMLFCHFWRAA